MATNFEDRQVSLSWGTPGSDTAMVQMQVVNPSEFIDAQAIVNDIIEYNPSMSGLTVASGSQIFGLPIQGLICTLNPEMY